MGEAREVASMAMGKSKEQKKQVISEAQEEQQMRSFDRSFKNTKAGLCFEVTL